MDRTDVFPDLDSFYEACLIDEGHKGDYNYTEMRDKDEPRFRGLSLNEMLRCKYSYDEGLKQLRTFDASGIIGSSGFVTKWSENDGEEMSMERAYEGMPYLLQRKRQLGSKMGKFVAINVVISENCGVGYQEMLNKTITAASLVGMLESRGFRTQVNAITDAAQVGESKNEGNKYEIIGRWITKVTVKQYQDPLNLSLLLTSISPWFFRYWTFLYWIGHCKSESGLGNSKGIATESTLTDIWINNGECLSKEQSDEFIKKVATLFQINPDEKNEQ